jgi:hypothetical protein
MSAVRNEDNLELICSALERNAGDVAGACADVGCSTGWLKKWMRDDPKVEVSIKDAIDTGTAVLESALIKRAVKGVKEPIYFKDQLVGHRRRYSDSNLQFALTARKRDVYGKQVEINTNISVKHLSDDELNAKIDMLANRLGVTLSLPSPDSIIDAEFEDVGELITVDDLL